MESHIDYTRIQSNARQKPAHSVEKDENVIKFDINADSCVEEISAQLPDDSPQPLGLPDNVLLRIMKCSGTVHGPTVDLIAQACRKLYLLSRTDAVWRHLAESANARQAPIPPLPYADARHLFLLRPRIRTDGLYISKITYFRRGESEHSLVQPVHLVTYYRYLRLFGAAESYSVWWLVTSKPPKEAIDLLRHPKRLTAVESLASGPTANVFHGHWNRDHHKERVMELRLEDVRGAKENRLRWYMRLELLDKAPSYRHRLLGCLEYSAVNSNGELTPIKTDDWGRFIFSKVRSYLT